LMYRRNVQLNARRGSRVPYSSRNQ
jgi:hypothetical protein